MKFLIKKEFTIKFEFNGNVLCKIDLCFWPKFTQKYISLMYIKLFMWVSAD